MLWVLDLLDHAEVLGPARDAAPAVVERLARPMGGRDRPAGWAGTGRVGGR